jgi:hypothetical protein
MRTTWCRVGTGGAKLRESQICHPADAPLGNTIRVLAEYEIRRILDRPYAVLFDTTTIYILCTTSLLSPHPSAAHALAGARARTRTSTCTCTRIRTRTRTRTRSRSRSRRSLGSAFPHDLSLLGLELGLSSTDRYRLRGTCPT